MEARLEHRLTLALCAACLALLAAGAWPQLTVRRGATEPITPDITVAVSGAVRAPGNYRLPWGSRVEELVARAGGLRPDADGALVRPADPLVEGMSVHVPAARTGAGDARVSLNRGTRAELESLPGIGPAIASRIVTARPFHAVADLESVQGIGPATLKRLRPLVTL